MALDYNNQTPLGKQAPYAQHQAPLLLKGAVKKSSYQPRSFKGYLYAHPDEIREKSQKG